MRMAYLAICATIKDEAPYIPEWIEFHRGVGVEHFFLYDNLSSDGSKEVLEPWVRAGLVTLSGCSIPFEQGGQNWAYADALSKRAGARAGSPSSTSMSSCSHPARRRCPTYSRTTSITPAS